jgi:parvulin-like peptidyl-prolyl isomerase
MEMKKSRLLLMPLLLAVAIAAAGCGGGGSKSVPADAVAVVGSTAIPKTSFTDLMNIATVNVKAHGQAAPKVGTAAYTQLRDQAVSFLVDEEELQQEGQKIGVTVTQKDVANRLKLIRTTYFKGSEKKLEAAVKIPYGTVDQFVTYNLRYQLLGEALKAKVTSNVKVSKTDAKRYYDQNKASFTTPQTREVRHILLTTKSQADMIERKLKSGASFDALAKKYSKDPGSAQQGGKLCVAHGNTAGACIQTLTPFDKAAFSLKTHEISAPVHTVDGWHVIQALSAIRPAHTQTFAEAESQIELNLASQKKDLAWSNWLAKVKKDYAGKVAYQTSYAPPATTTPSVPAPTTTG